MAGSGIDPRYPAEFQRGGETSSKALEEPQVPPEYSENLDPDPAVLNSDVSKEAVTAEVHATDEPVETDEQQAVTSRGQRVWWLFPVVTSLVLMVAGIIVLFIHKLLPSSLEQNPEQQDGMVVAPWVAVVPYQAGYIFSAGLLALLVTMLVHAYSIRTKHLALIWRSLIITVSLAAIATGLWCGTSYLFNNDLSAYTGEYERFGLSFDRIVAPAAFPLMFVGLILFSLALCFPHVSRPTGKREASISWLALSLLGATITVLGFCCLLAQQLFPQVRPEEVALDFGAYPSLVPVWTDVATTLSPAPTWAGLVLMAAAGVGFGFQLRARPSGATDAVSQPEH